MAPARALAALVSCAALCSMVCATAPRPHVSLPEAPTRDAPFEQRSAYYKAHSADTLERDHVFLHDGTRVYWPEDLGPAVDDGSPTAKAIADHVEAREVVEGFAPLGTVFTAAYAVGGLGLMGGLVVMLAAPVALLVLNQQHLAGVSSNDLTFGSLAAGGVMMGAGSVILLGAMLGQWGFSSFVVGEDVERAAESAERAARTYNQSLTDRLGVGVDANGVIFDLKQPTAAPPSSPDDGQRDL